MAGLGRSAGVGLLVIALGFTVAVAGCGGGDSDDQRSSSSSTTSATKGRVACAALRDAWDKLGAGVAVTPEAAQVDADVILAEQPPVEVQAGLQVLVKAADGLSGDELGFDADQARTDVGDWVDAQCPTLG